MTSFHEVILEASKLKYQVKALLDSHKFYKDLAEKRGKALEYYASVGIYKSNKEVYGNGSDRPAVLIDAGDMARKALSNV